jgi:hypothetical protein
VLLQRVLGYEEVYQGFAQWRKHKDTPEKSNEETDTDLSHRAQEDRSQN